MRAQSIMRPDTLPRAARPRRAQHGQALVLALFTSVLVILALFAMYSMGGQSIEKIKLQNTADAAAYSAALAEARDYNFSAYTNRAMIANQVAVAQFVGMTSWFRNMSAFANGDSSNLGRDVYDAFFMIPSPLGNFYKKFLKAFGKAMGIFDETKVGTKFMEGAVTMLDGLIMVYGETQRIYHYATALTVAETLGVFTTLGSKLDGLLGVSLFAGPMKVLDGGDDIINKNDDKAGLTTGALPYLAYHYFKWFKFTEFKDPNTDGKDGANADRFAQVTMNSLDDFSRDRSTKPAWGFTFFYAPPLTFVDPTRFIPYQNGPLFLPVIHRGGTELKVTSAAGTGGTAGTGGGAGDSGVDCHGNTVASGSSSAISVDQYSQLAPFSAGACDGDSGMVKVGDATHPQGVYAFRNGTWIDPSSLTNTQGNAGTTTSPAANGSAHPGAPGSKSKKNWTALDASSWAGLDLIWISIIGIPIPLPLPFAPPWIPLSHGAAQSGKKLDPPTVLAGDNNFGVDAAAAYGEALDSWTTKVSAAMRQSKGAGKSLDLSAKLGGITKYMDVTDVAAENLTGPPLVVEIEKKVSDTPQNPGTGQFSTDNGAPQGKMRSLSKSQVYFSRPTSDSALAWFKRVNGTATQTEVGSLYNPYWQARLMPNTFIEQYISMEMHRVGI